MKRLLIILTIALCASQAVMAQGHKGNRQVLTEENREKWLNEMRTYKHDFLTRELNLTKEQQDAFFPVYDEMDNALTRVQEETRQLESKVTADEEASDIEIEAAARALFEQKGREGIIETEYFEKFKETLTPKQLLRLKNAERKFTQQLVKQHGRIRSSK